MSLDIQHGDLPPRPNTTDPLLSLTTPTKDVTLFRRSWVMQISDAIEDEDSGKMVRFIHFRNNRWTKVEDSRQNRKLLGLQ